MSNFQKSHMTVDGNTVHMSMPFEKVDEAKRLVSGFATLDNIDSQGDIVLAEASVKAFGRARGNIREMHQPIAVGKMVDFREDEFFHDGDFYRGIFVTAHVSEGAEDTWKKVLDGTLTGFSIGGEINEASNEFVKEAGRTIRFIKDYDLVELSLVDNPANQLANVLSIQKSASGNITVKMGEVVDTVVENVFICPVDETVVVKDTASETCPKCETKMENAGWFETGANRAEKVQNIVTKFLNPVEEEAAPISESEGGVEMGDKVIKSESEDESVEVEETEAESVEEVESEEEAAEEVEEVVDEENEISKKIDDLHEAVKDSLEKTRSETSEQVAALEKKIEEATEQFLSKASELESKWDEFGHKIEAQKNRLSELENSLEKMNSSEAFKKSGDVESKPVSNVQTNDFWKGAFSD